MNKANDFVIIDSIVVTYEQGEEVVYNANLKLWKRLIKVYLDESKLDFLSFFTGIEFLNCIRIDEFNKKMIIDLV